MVLTRLQEEGLRIAVERYKNKEPYTCIAGYAGSGKSTLIKFIISALGVNPEEDVSYVAFTGKAATVLQSKGCANATTAHKLLYKAVPMPNGSYKFVPKTTLDKDYKVIVVDEISMLPKPMWDLLLTHNVYILATGDPGQLPPIDKNMDNGVLYRPHVFLTEVMRQAQDSEIIRLSMWIREGKSIETFPVVNEQVKIFSKYEVVSGMYDWADQILCATNAKRNEINNFVRQKRGYGKEPEIGDKIISLRNHWDYLSATGTWALTNGSIGMIEHFYVEKQSLPSYISSFSVPYMYTDILLEDGDHFNITPIDYISLTTGSPALDKRQSYLLAKSKVYPDPPFDFAYAYAITTHKAQGSEWDKVLVYEENFPFDAQGHMKWLYTAGTRAKEKLVIIKK